MPVLPRKSVLDLRPYPAPDFSRYSYARLDFNENTDGFPSLYPQDLEPHLVSAYPEYYEFIRQVCAFYSIEADSVLLTNGSDEGLMMVATTFIEPTVPDGAVLSKPCFIVMPHSLKFAGAALREVDVHPDLSFNVSGLEQALAENPKIAMFATPENPTGAILDSNTILDWCARFPETLFVIDEAYGEYSGTTVVPFVRTTANLMVLKTFSKAWGMAGLRLGLVIAQPYLIDYLNRVRSPFNVNSIAVKTAAKLLERGSFVLEAAALTMRRKVALENELAQRGHRLVRGGSNSFLLGLGINAANFERFARERKVLVRNRSDAVYPGSSPSRLWGYVRVSAGTDSENEKFLTVLSEYEQTFGGSGALIEQCYPDLYVGEER